jgi:hypothetical protein
LSATYALIAAAKTGALLAVALILFAGSVFADSDWQVIGGATDSDYTDVLFFDASSVRKNASYHLEVSLKSLDGDELTGKRKHLSRQEREGPVKKYDAGYRPPMAKFMKLDVYKTLNILLSEEVANRNDLDPVMSMLAEIDCSNHLIRALSMTKNTKNAPTVEMPTKWEPVTPKSGYSNLQTVLC